MRYFGYKQYEEAMADTYGYNIFSGEKEHTQNSQF